MATWMSGPSLACDQDPPQPPEPGSICCRASAARVELSDRPRRRSSPYGPTRPDAPLSTSSPAGLYADRRSAPARPTRSAAYTDASGNGPATAAARLRHPAINLPGLTSRRPPSRPRPRRPATAPRPANTGTSRVVGLAINGSAVEVPPGDAAQEIPLGPGPAASPQPGDRRRHQADPPRDEVVTSRRRRSSWPRPIVGYGAGACRTAPRPPSRSAVGTAAVVPERRPRSARRRDLRPNPQRLRDPRGSSVIVVGAPSRARPAAR